MRNRFREFKERSRRLLHDKLCVPVVFCNSRGDGDYQIWNGRVRIYNKNAYAGDLKGTNYHYAELIDDAPRIIFMVDEGANIQKNTFVGVDRNEIYQLSTADPTDVITKTYRAARLDGSDLQKYADIMFPREDV